VAVSSLPDRSATTRGSSHSISASSGPVSHLGGQVAGSPQGGGQRAFPPDGALIADPDSPRAGPAGLMTTTSVDTSARPERKPSGPAAIPQAASMLSRLELVSQLVMIAAAASLYGPPPDLHKQAEDYELQLP
jgi:hypothetical protein